MNARKLLVFKHDSMLGNAPAHKLFDLVTVKRSNDASIPARAFSDYDVAVDRNNLAAECNSRRNVLKRESDVRSGRSSGLRQLFQNLYLF